MQPDQPPRSEHQHSPVRLHLLRFDSFADKIVSRFAVVVLVAMAASLEAAPSGRSVTLFGPRQLEKELGNPLHVTERFVVPASGLVTLRVEGTLPDAPVRDEDGGLTIDKTRILSPRNLVGETRQEHDIPLAAGEHTRAAGRSATRGRAARYYDIPEDDPMIGSPMRHREHNRPQSSPGAAIVLLVVTVLGFALEAWGAATFGSVIWSAGNEFYRLGVPA